MNIHKKAGITYTGLILSISKSLYYAASEFTYLVNEDFKLPALFL